MRAFKLKSSIPVLLLFFCWSCGSDNNETQFSAALSGTNQVPPVTTSATGTAKFILDSNDKSIQYFLDVTNISQAFASSIHTGAAGTNGDAVATLFDGPFTSGSFTGRLASGTITVNSVKGITFDQLVTMMNAGQAYVSVQTTMNPQGEIRGQIERLN